MCSVCDAPKKRIDVHLQKVHLLRRGSLGFRKALNESAFVNAPAVPSSVQTLDTVSGSVEISTEDGLKAFLEAYNNYLEKYTSLGKMTRQRNMKMVGDLLQHGLGQNSVSLITGTRVCNIFQAAACENLLGYLFLKRDIFTASYSRKIINACKSALECLKLDKTEFKITHTLYRLGSSGKL